MDRAIETALRSLQDLWAVMTSTFEKAQAYIEPWHLGVFILGLWLLAKLTGPKFHGRR